MADILSSIPLIPSHRYFYKNFDFLITNNRDDIEYQKALKLAIDAELEFAGRENLENAINVYRKWIDVRETIKKTTAEVIEDYI